MHDEDETPPRPLFSEGSRVFTVEGIGGTVTAVHASDNWDEEHTYRVRWDDGETSTDEPESLFD